MTIRTRQSMTRQREAVRQADQTSNTSAKSDELKTEAQTATADDGYATSTKAAVDPKVQTAARQRAAAVDPSVAAKIQEPNRLAADAERFGLKTNQDLINHGYQRATETTSNADGNYAKAGEFLQKQYGVDINELAKSRDAAIDTKKTAPQTADDGYGQTTPKKEPAATADDGYVNAPQEAATADDGYVNPPQETATADDGYVNAPQEAATADDGYVNAPSGKTAPAATADDGFHGTSKIAGLARAAAENGGINQELRQALSDGDVSGKDLNAMNAAYAASINKTNAAMKGSSADEAAALAGQSANAELYDQAVREHYGDKLDLSTRMKLGVVNGLEKADQLDHQAHIMIKKAFGR